MYTSGVDKSRAGAFPHRSFYHLQFWQNYAIGENGDFSKWNLELNQIVNDLNPVSNEQVSLPQYYLLHPTTVEKSLRLKSKKVERFPPTSEFNKQR